MNILLATDGSIHSNAAIEEVANRPFPAGKQVLVLSVYDFTTIIVSEPPQMGGLAGGYKEAGYTAIDLAKKTVKIASEIIKEKNLRNISNKKQFLKLNLAKK